MRPQRIRLLHFITGPSPSHYFNAIGAKVDRDRFDVTVGTLSPPGQLQEDMASRGLGTFGLGYTSRWEFPRAVVELAALLRRERFDILQVHLFEASLVGLAAGSLARTPLKIFTGHHSAELLRHDKGHLLLADCLCTRLLCDFVLSPSDETKRIFVDKEGVDPDRVAVIGYPLDLDAWAPPASARDRVREELSLPQDGPVFGACGRLFELKNFPDMLRSFALFAQRKSEGHLVIVGDGPDRAKIEGLSRDLSIESRVRFAGRRSDVADVFAAIDVFVHASRVESCCQVLIEAGLVGKPILSTPVPPIRKLVVDRVSGWIVPVGDCSAMAEAMVDAVERSREWPAMGAQVKRRANEYGSATIVPKMEAQYLCWLAKVGRKPRPPARIGGHVPRPGGRDAHPPSDPSRSEYR